MEILIAGHAFGGLKKLLVSRPKELDAVIITDDGVLFPEWVRDLTKEHIWVSFDDTLETTDYYKAATIDQIKEILEWGKDREHVVVACHAGISRSSAVAVLLAFQETGDVEKSVFILDTNRHYPNGHIIKIGCGILNSPAFWKRCISWSSKQQSQYTEDFGSISDEAQEVEVI